MAKGALFIHDASKEHNGPNAQPADEFIAIAGSIELGSKPIAGLKIGSYTETIKGIGQVTHDYMDIVHDMNFDVNHAGFYHLRKSENERFTSFTEAIEKYNETILTKSGNPQVVAEHLIYNVPRQEVELAEGYINGEGYRSNPESCMILSYQESPEDPDKSTVLIHRNGKFAVLENVSKDQNGRLNLQSVPRPRFNTDNLQDILNEFAVKSKCDLEYETNDIKSIKKETAQENKTVRDDDDGR